MKNWIKKYLRESLDEVKTRKKNLFGNGAYHNIYRSNKYPDRLFKVGDEDTVDEWVSTFKENPKYFPKIYRVFPYKKNPRYKVVEIEMLNTNQASLELSKLDNFLINISDQVDCNGEIVNTLNFFEPSCINKVVMAAHATDQPNMLPLIYKWAKFLISVSSIVEKDLGRPLDLHHGNVATDNAGNLKMIDI